MPLYSDYGMYYGGGVGGGYSVPPPAYTSSPYSPYGSSYGRTPVSSSPYASPVSTRGAFPMHSASSRYSPMLSTITETPYSSAAISAAGRYAGMSSLMRINSPKLNYHSSPKYVAPRPIRVNTADIDVSAVRHKRSLPLITPTRINNSLPMAISSSSSNNRTTSDQPQSRRSRSETPPPEPVEETHFMPRCDENDAPPQYSHPIKRDRTIVRISTVRQRSKGPSEMPALASERGPPNPPAAAATPVIVVDVSNVVGDQGGGNVKRTWRDNFGEDLLTKPREAVKKTPGELLLERHLIKSEGEKKGASGEGSIVDILLRNRDAGSPSKFRRPSFHDICQEISSDKIESVDDLNAGELRRRASLLPDDDDEDDEDDEEGDDEQEESDGEQAKKDLDGDANERHGAASLANGHLQADPHNDLSTNQVVASGGGGTVKRPVNKITKSASGTLHCLLERHLHNSSSSPNDPTAAAAAAAPSSGGAKRKSVKRVHHKITAKVHIDEPTPKLVINNSSGGVASSSSSPRAKIEKPSGPVADRTPQLNAIVEHVSEHHHVNHVVSLPGKKRDKEALPKKIVRPKATAAATKDNEEDFWGVIGTRETIYCNNRKQQLKQRLQTCTEDSEEVPQQFQESVLSEVPQSPTVEKKEDPSINYQPDLMKQVPKKAVKTPKPVIEKDNKKNSPLDTVAVVKTTVAESADGRENSKIGLKIAPTTTTTTSSSSSTATKTAATSKVTRDLDAKSPASSGRAIDSSHEEIVLGKGKNKQTPPVSSINTTTVAAAQPEGPSSNADASESAATVAVKKKKIVTKKVVARTKKTDEEQSATTTITTSGESSLTSSTHPLTKAPAATKLKQKAAAEKSPTQTKNAAKASDRPSGGGSSDKSSSSSMSCTTTSTLASVAAALQTTTTTTTTAAKSVVAEEEQSMAGTLSKFRTIDKLNLLSSVDSDQSSTIDEMAVESSVSRAEKTAPSASAVPNAVAKSEPVSDSEMNSADGMDKASETASLSPASSTGVGAGEKKKKKVRRVVKRIRQSPAERSNSNVNIGIWSMMEAAKKAHHKAQHGYSDEEGHESEVAKEGGQEVNNNHHEGAEEAEEHKETIQELIRRVKGKDKVDKESPSFDPQKCKKFSPDTKVKLFTVDEKAPKVLWATPRPLQKQPKKVVVEYSSDEDSSEENSDGEATPVSSATDSEEPAANPQQPEELTLNLYGYKDERMSSTCSTDSGFEGGTAPSSPKNMLGKQRRRGPGHRTSRVR